MGDGPAREARLEKHMKGAPANDCGSTATQTGKGMQSMGSREPSVAAHRQEQPLSVSWRLEMRLQAHASSVLRFRTNQTVSADSAVVWLSSRTKSYSARTSCAPSCANSGCVGATYIFEHSHRQWMCARGVRYNHSQVNPLTFVTQSSAHTPATMPAQGRCTAAQAVLCRMFTTHGQKACRTIKFETSGSASSACQLHSPSLGRHLAQAPAAETYVTQLHMQSRDC